MARHSVYRADARRGVTGELDPRREHSRRTPFELRGLLDIGFVLVLVVVALYGFRTTFIGQQYLLVALVGAVLGVGISTALAVWRLPVWLAAPATAIAYYLFAGVLVFRDEAPGGVLPGGAVLREATSVLRHGWKELLTTLPPVAADGRLLAIPYLIGLVAAVAGCCIAQRTSTRTLPALPPVLALAAVIALGTSTPAARLWQGIAFGTLVVCWAAVRRPGAKPLSIRVTPGGPQRLVIGALVLTVAGTAAALLQPHVPGADRHRVVARDYVDPPFDIARYASPLVGFRKYTKNARLLYGQTLFTVRGTDGLRTLRIATLDDYDGTVWGATNGTVPTEPGEPIDAFQRVGTQVAGPQSGRAVTLRVRIGRAYAASDDVNAWVPGAGRLRSVVFAGERADQHAESFRYNLATGAGITAARLAAGDSYTVRERVGATSLPAGATPAGAPTLASSATSFVASRANQWSARSEGVMKQTAAVARYMRENGAYSDGGPGEAQYLPGHSTGRLTAFLNAAQLVGDDEQYAAAYALICNYLGLPARVALVAEPQADGTVEGKDVHAAVEVHVRTAGGTRWAMIPRSRFMPDKDKKPKKQPPQTEQDAKAAVVPPPNPVQPPSTRDDPDRPDQNTQRLGKLAKKDDGVLSGWFGTVVLWVAIPVLVLLLIAAAIIGIKWRRRVLRRTRGTIPDRFDAGWREYLDAARDLGAVVPRGRTRTEQAAALESRPAGDRAAPLAHGADRGVFGPGDPPAEAAESYWRDVDDARRAMAHDAGRFGRVRAALNLRSLRRPPRAAV